MLSMKKYTKQVYIALVVAISLLLLIDYLPNVDSYVSPPIALFLGLLFALLFGQAYPKFNKKVSKKLLQYSVVGLGFGMNLQASLQSGKEGMAFTIVSVVGTMLIGWLIGRKLLKVERDTSYLISSGTAICGGSAIAAVGPVLKAKDTEMSVALGTVFILNAIALFVFPIIGHALDMTQQQFGMWAAIAIHDTSSVVGAGAAYGEEALQVATTIKLTRALWIIPLALATSFILSDSAIAVWSFHRINIASGFSANSGNNASGVPSQSVNTGVEAVQSNDKPTTPSATAESHCDKAPFTASVNDSI